VRVQDAAASVAYLTAMVSGYNDDTAEMLVYEFTELDDAQTLDDAVKTVVRSWDRQGRVPIKLILDEYARIIRNGKQQQHLTRTSRADPLDPIPTAERGRAIAAASYADDCEERGVEPNWKRFDQIIGST
jgi:hypothetical protein